MSGWKLYSKIKDLISDIEQPVVVCILSGSDRSSDIEAFNELDIPFFIRKPLTARLYRKLKNNYTYHFSKIIRSWNQK